MSQTATTINTVQHMLLQMRNAFVADMPVKLEKLDHLLLDIENHGSTQDTFNEFYRIVHSLKGSGGTYGLHIITTICHQLEDLLNATDEGKSFPPATIEACLSYVDLLRLAVEQIQEDLYEFPLIETKLQELQKRITTKPFRILIIDHSRLSTHIYLQSLAELPAQCITINEGLLGLRRLLTEPFDLLVTTNEIPVLNGIALIGALRLSSSRNRNIKCVLITSDQKIFSKTRRSIDANYIILKDANLANNLQKTAHLALRPTSQTATDPQTSA